VLEGGVFSEAAVRLDFGATPAIQSLRVSVPTHTVSMQGVHEAVALFARECRMRPCDDVRFTVCS